MKTSTLLKKSRIPQTNGNGNGDEEALLESKGKKAAVKKVEVIRLDRAKIRLHLVGETGLIVHDFDEKSIKQMLDKQMGKASRGREKKDPLAAFKGSLYKLPKGGYGFPARGFKACFVKASNDVELVKTEMKRALRVLGTGEEAMSVEGLIRIQADPLPKALWGEYDKEYQKDLKVEHAHGISMRRDMVRLETGVADIRFRGFFPRWSCDVDILFNRRMISEEQLTALVDAAGFGVGIGEWRPGAPKSESGQFGCFTVGITKKK
jgi:hypothetical protein